MYIRENNCQKQDVNVVTFPNKEAINLMLKQYKQNSEKSIKADESTDKTIMNDRVLCLMLALLLTDNDIDKSLCTLLAVLLQPI